MNSTSSPFISVVVCVFNEEELLQKCLEGLSKQSYASDCFEVLIIDDESTDQSFNIAANFIKNLHDDLPYIKCISIHHGGLSVARNVGIQQSKGDIIAFIDGDAIPDADWLKEIAYAILAGADYVGGRIDLLNTYSWVARFLQQTRHRQFFGPKIYNDQCIGCNMAFRSHLFKEIGGFNENFISRGDESTLQLKIRGRFKYGSAEKAVVLHERPSKIRDVIKITWKSSTLLPLSEKAGGKRMKWNVKMLIIEQFFMTFFPLFLCIFWINPALFTVPLLITAFANVRRLFIRPLNFAILRELIKEYGIFVGLISHVVYGYISNLLEFFGRIAGVFKYHSSVVIPPATSSVSTVKTIDNAISETIHPVYSGNTIQSTTEV